MIRVAANMNAVYVIILAIALLVLCGFGSSFERCQKVEKRVWGICPFYNSLRQLAKCADISFELLSESKTKLSLSLLDPQ